MTSVVIAAHNEAAVIRDTLRALLSGVPSGTLDVTVVANGCTDGTAAVAGAVAGVRVVELPAAGKPAALNAGDAVAVGYPRVYLDADIRVTGADVDAVVAALGQRSAAAPHRAADPVAGDTCLAAAPRRELDLAGRPLLVRAYYAVHNRLPAIGGGLFGRGMVALSAAGRARFGEFPDQVADDLFLDSLFTGAEKRVVAEVSSTVATPRRTRDLVRRLARVRAGNAALRATSPRTRRAARLSWLRDVVLPRPWLAPAAVCYVAITVVAAVLARQRSRAGSWGRDESSRAATR